MKDIYYIINLYFFFLCKRFIVEFFVVGVNIGIVFKIIFLLIVIEVLVLIF